MAIMTTSHQIIVSVLSSVIVAGAVGYGSANFSAGELRNQVNVNTETLKDRATLVQKASGYDARLTAVEARVNTFERLVIDGQKEQREISSAILREIALMRKDTAINTTKIGAIEVDISEIKDRVDK